MVLAHTLITPQSVEISLIPQDDFMLRGVRPLRALASGSGYRPSQGGETLSAELRLQQIYFRGCLFDAEGDSQAASIICSKASFGTLMFSSNRR